MQMLQKESTRLLALNYYGPISSRKGQILNAPRYGLVSSIQFAAEFGGSNRLTPLGEKRNKVAVPSRFRYESFSRGPFVPWRSPAVSDERYLRGEMKDSVEKSAEVRLLVIDGPDRGTELCVPAPSDRSTSISIGRSGGSEHDLRLTDRGVSRRHATLTVAGGICKLNDGDGSMPSTNGTTVNHLAVAFNDPRVMHFGDEIRLGPFTVIRFEIHAKTAARVHQAPAADAEAKSGGPETSPVMMLPPLRLPGDLIARTPTAREQFGPYDVYGMIDQGRHDRVDVAMDRESHVPVALKRFVDLSQRAGVRDRILEDAARSRRWHHPSIVRALDCGVLGEIPYVVTRLVDGITLTTVRERSRVDPTLTAYVIGLVCEGLTYAHTVEPAFVHGWLTPRRIMLNRRGEVALLNFGNAPIQALVSGLAGEPGSSEQYRAPEFSAGARPLPRCDVFSLGLILTELIIGRPIEMAETADLSDLNLAASGMPPRLVAIARCATSTAPDSRFQTAAEMQEQLAVALHEMTPTYGAHTAAQAVSRIAAAGSRPEPCAG